MTTGRVCKEPTLAVWAITERGRDLALHIAGRASHAEVFVLDRVPCVERGVSFFSSLSAAVAERFHRCNRHVFVMAVGIAVRMVGPHLGSKMTDPAVVVLDDAARFAVSVLSGHLGGANELCRHVAAWTGATPVITTATDVHGLPAVDLIARQRGLFVENPERIKAVHKRLLEGRTVRVFDPRGFLGPGVGRHGKKVGRAKGETGIHVIVSDLEGPRPEGALVLRPPSLCVGVGCNRNTGLEELLALFTTVFGEAGLSKSSVRCLATVDIKGKEPGIVGFADLLGVGVRLFSASRLSGVKGVVHPSETVYRHMGVFSVCEAAALCAAGATTLVVAKKKSPNATLAVARRSFSSSA